MTIEKKKRFGLFVVKMGILVDAAAIAAEAPLSLAFIIGACSLLAGLTSVGNRESITRDEESEVNVIRKHKMVTMTMNETIALDCGTNKRENGAIRSTNKKSILVVP